MEVNCDQPSSQALKLGSWFQSAKLGTCRGNRVAGFNQPNLHVVKLGSARQQNINAYPSTADANCNNFALRRPIATNNTSIERQKQGLHFVLVVFLIAPPVTEFEATRAEATQNHNNTHTPLYSSYKHYCR